MLRILDNGILIFDSSGWYDIDCPHFTSDCILPFKVILKQFYFISKHLEIEKVKKLKFLITVVTDRSYQKDICVKIMDIGSEFQLF